MSTLNKVLVRILVVLALPLAGLMFALVLADSLDLISIEARGSPDDPPPSPEARAGAAAPKDAVHGAGAIGVLAIVISGLTALLVRPERADSAYQVLGASAGMLIAAVIAGNPDNYGGQAGPVDPAFLLLAVPAVLAGLAARPWRGKPDNAAPRRLLLAFAMLAAVPAANYGIEQGLMQRNTFPPAADPHHQAHWYAMSVAAFATVLVVATSVIGTRGWRLSASLGGFAAMLIAGASIISSASASALHPAWAMASLLWGILVLVVAWRGSTRLRADPGLHHPASATGAP
jgi:hypothetical protein